MTEAQMSVVWETYSTAWSNVSEEERKRLLEQSVDAEVAFSAPSGEDRGRDYLLTTLHDFQQAYSGASFRTRNFVSHHNRSLAEWDMVGADGTVLLTGSSTGVYSDSGQLRELVGFWRTA